MMRIGSRSAVWIAAGISGIGLTIAGYSTMPARNGGVERIALGGSDGNVPGTEDGTRDAGDASEPVTAARAPLRHLAIGGGAVPESTEVSIEQNLALAHRVLPAPGAVLFAGGSGSVSVRTEAPGQGQDPLLVRLGELFQPRPGRRSRYRAPSLHAGPAKLSDIEHALEQSLRDASAPPLFVFVAAHGEQGDAPHENAVVTWGNDALTPARLAELHDAHPRPVRFVVTSCFSGGFAELAFEAADEARGVTKAPRCGLFSGTWDRETAGCDPDPNRRAQESYSQHFLHALAGQDRDGAPLPRARLDLDGDGRISLLEAHARARIAARSIDVPTTTSERYLRAVQPEAAPFEQVRASLGRDAPRMPEEAAVVAQLGALLGLSSADEARIRLAALATQRTALDEQVADAEAEQDARYWALATRLLARWPVLDDAYHPQLAETLIRDHVAIAEVLDRSPEATAYRGASDALTALDGRALELELNEARVLRLVRAYETLEHALSLYKRGGADLEHYEELLACERDTLAGG